MPKKYVISEYGLGYMAMYENDDFRLKDNVTILEGTFKRDKTVEGTFNGEEIGIFTCNNGEKYLIFYDYSAKKL